MTEKDIIETYRGGLYVRYDDKGIARYFTADDFTGLCREKFCF